MTLATEALNYDAYPYSPQLEPEEALAIAARDLHLEGYDDHHYGHITWRQPSGTLLATPFGLSWDELEPEDIVRISTSGEQLSGRWPVTPSITLHTALHAARPASGVAIHHHPRFGTVWAIKREVPPAYDQIGALIPDDDLVVFKDYVGGVAGADAARANIAALGSCNAALLANHGVMVLGDTIREAFNRAVILEWRCRQAWYVAAAGGGQPMPEREAVILATTNKTLRGTGGTGFPDYFDLGVRRQLRRDPVLAARVRSAAAVDSRA
jgi:ribulose-5-phosphate 4-epimerase/fuculose-1-phosphate aldolase